MRDQVGVMIPRGVVQGIEEETARQQQAVQNAFRSLVQPALSGAESGINGVNNYRTDNRNQSLTVQIINPKMGDKMDARAAAYEILGVWNNQTRALGGDAIMEGWFDFAGIRSTTLGVVAQDFPPVTLPAERADFQPIPGRSGSLTILEGDAVYDDITISIGCYIKDLTMLDQISTFLRGSGVLVLSGAPDRFYVARAVNQIELKQIVRGKTHRSFNAVFRCSPLSLRLPRPSGLPDLPAGQ